MQTVGLFRSGFIDFWIVQICKPTQIIAMKIYRLLLTAVLLFATIACAMFSPDSENLVIEVSVQADQGWQDSAVKLQPGQELLIEYLSGQITDGEATIIDGTGSDYICGSSGCCEPIQDARRSSLIGRVGRTDAEIFYVGNGIENTVDTSGNLFLRINDCNSGLNDNFGSFRVHISTR